MESLHAVVAAHGCVLVLDAATTCIQAGLLRPHTAPVWRRGGDDAGVHLFLAASQCLEAGGLRPTEVGAFVFCDGPGSQLGIRTAAMAIRTWQALRAAPAPLFAYRSLHVAAAARHRTAAGGAPFAVVCDARRESWHAVRIDAAGAVSDVLRVSSSELRTWPEPLHQPEGFRAWSPPPRPALPAGYDCAEIFHLLGDEPVLFRVDEAEPWQSAPVSYQTWSGERHRGAAQQAAAAQQ